jgi:hypothetical protein
MYVKSAYIQPTGTPEVENLSYDLLELIYPIVSKEDLLKQIKELVKKEVGDEWRRVKL